MECTGQRSMDTNKQTHRHSASIHLQDAVFRIYESPLYLRRSPDHLRFITGIPTPIRLSSSWIEALCLSHRMTSQWCNYGNHRFIIIGHPCRFVKFYQYPRYQIKKNNNMIWNVRKYNFHQLNEHLWMFNLICIKQAGTFGSRGFHCDVIKGM